MWYWLFINHNNNSYIVLSDQQLEDDGRWILEDDNYMLIWDSARSRNEAENYAERFYNARKVKLETIPVSLKTAAEFVNKYHRHHKAPQGHKFSIGITDGENLAGVIIAGRPVARHNDDGLTLEITRCCVKKVYKNGVSKLHAAVCQAAKAVGYKRVITYTLSKESGKSLRASGFQFIRTVKGRSWHSKARQRVDKHPIVDKFFWMRTING